MALYLNTDAAYKDFQMLRNDKYFVDKSAMIEKINERIKTKNRFLCITKPRRFGKTSALNMLGAYYGKGCPAGKLLRKFQTGIMGTEWKMAEKSTIHVPLFWL